MARKFAFIKSGSFSNVNDKVAQALVEHLPTLEIHVIDIKSLVKSNKLLIMVNILFVLKEYGVDILLGNKRIKECFWRTTYIFKRMKTLVLDHLSQNEYEFSFQTQSLFDGSKQGLPHYIYTDHTHLANLHYPGFEKKRLYNPRWIELERTIYKNATLNFTMGSHVAKSIIEDYSCPQHKVVCVNVGSNIGTDFKVDRAKYNNKNILFVGIDWERKGGPELVEAFKLVLRVHPDAQLTIVGCSPKLNILNCDVVGRVPLERLNHYYERASVFCLPTRLEPFGIVFLEAFAHGLPVVATEIGAIPGFVLNDETGHLVKPGDVEHLSKVLIELVGNPEKCRTLGKNGRRLVLQKFTWEKVGAEIAKNIMATVSH